MQSHYFSNSKKHRVIVPKEAEFIYFILDVYETQVHLPVTTRWPMDGTREQFSQEPHCSYSRVSYFRPVVTLPRLLGVCSWIQYEATGRLKENGVVGGRKAMHAAAGVALLLPAECCSDVR